MIELQEMVQTSEIELGTPTNAVLTPKYDHYKQDNLNISLLILS